MNLSKQIYPAVALTIVLTVLLGIIYPFVMTGLSELLFEEKARGSLIEREGKVVGSRLIGGNLSKDQTIFTRGLLQPVPVMMRQLRAGQILGRRVNSFLRSR